MGNIISLNGAEMTKFKNKFRIETTRLSVWDYSNPGWYFITINTKNHIEHFGKIINAKMILNDIGKIADKCWTDLPKHFVNIKLDYYVIMPNHIHGIIIINEHTNDYGKDVACNVSTTETIYSRISPQKIHYQ